MSNTQLLINNNCILHFLEHTCTICFRKENLSVILYSMSTLKLLKSSVIKKKNVLGKHARLFKYFKTFFRNK